MMLRQHVSLSQPALGYGQTQSNTTFRPSSPIQESWANSETSSRSRRKLRFQFPPSRHDKKVSQNSCSGLCSNDDIATKASHQNGSSLRQRLSSDVIQFLKNILKGKQAPTKASTSKWTAGASASAHRDVRFQRYKPTVYTKDYSQKSPKQFEHVPHLAMSRPKSFCRHHQRLPTPQAEVIRYRSLARLPSLHLPVEESLASSGEPTSYNNSHHSKPLMMRYVNSRIGPPQGSQQSLTSHSNGGGRRRNLHDSTTRHFLKKEICPQVPPAGRGDLRRSCQQRKLYNKALQYAIERAWSSPKHCRHRSAMPVKKRSTLATLEGFNNLTPIDPTASSDASFLKIDKQSGVSLSFETQLSQEGSSVSKASKSTLKAACPVQPLSGAEDRPPQVSRPSRSNQLEALLSPSHLTKTKKHLQPPNDREHLYAMYEVRRLLRSSRRFSQHAMPRGNRKHIGQHILESSRRRKKFAYTSLTLLLPTRRAEVDFLQYGYAPIESLAYTPGSHTHVVRHLGNNDLWVAKCVDLTKMTVKEARVAKLEVEYLKRLQHPFILKLKESFITDSSMIIITEYCSKGDLLSFLKHHEKTARIFHPDCDHVSIIPSSGIVPRSLALQCPNCHKDVDMSSQNAFVIETSSIAPQLIIKWITQLALGLQYMHSEGIIHCDLKTSNVFLTEDYTAKIGDLGIAREMQAAMTYISRGTPNYMSPEACVGQEITDKSDSWALGCVLYEMIFLRYAFQHTLEDQAVSYTMSWSVGHFVEEINRRLPQIKAELRVFKTLISNIAASAGDSTTSKPMRLGLAIASTNYSESSPYFERSETLESLSSHLDPAKLSGVADLKTQATETISQTASPVTIPVGPIVHLRFPVTKPHNEEPFQDILEPTSHKGSTPQSPNQKAQNVFCFNLIVHLLSLLLEPDHEFRCSVRHVIEILYSAEYFDDAEMSIGLRSSCACDCFSSAKMSSTALRRAISLSFVPSHVASSPQHHVPEPTSIKTNSSWPTFDQERSPCESLRAPSLLARFCSADSTPLWRQPSPEKESTAQLSSLRRPSQASLARPSPAAGVTISPQLEAILDHVHNLPKRQVFLIRSKRPPRCAAKKTSPLL